MIKWMNTLPSHENTFIRDALLEAKLRLDGRGVEDSRNVSINLHRGETDSRSEVQVCFMLVCVGNMTSSNLILFYFIDW